MPYLGLDKLFSETVDRVINEKWILVYKARHWWDIFPTPDLTSYEETPHLFLNNLPGFKYTPRNPKLQWQVWSMDLYNSYQKSIISKLEEMRRHISDEISAWNYKNPQKNIQIDLDKVYSEWLSTVDHHSVKEFWTVPIGEKTAKAFVTPKFNELKERYEVKIASELNTSSKQVASALFIKPEARNELFEALKPYIQEGEYGVLTELINGKLINEPIIVNCKQNTLGKIFYEAYRNKLTESTKKAFVCWICKNFQRKVNNKIFTLSESTMNSHLKGLGFGRRYYK